MKICVFTGSSFGARECYRQAARELGLELAGRRITLVYGGATVGLMGTVADAALSGGGKVIGVLTESLAELEIAHTGLTDLRIVPSMHERKAAMADLSDAFIVMPGGLGTLEEAFEIWTWSQLGIHHKPIGLLNVDGYYDGLEHFLDHMVDEQFVRSIHRNAMLSETDPARLIDALIRTEVPRSHKWVEPGNR